MEIKLPNLGDGIDSAVVLSILVKPGDVITVEQTILELETDKAVAPIPAPKAGTVTAVHIKVGDTVKMGTLVLSLDGASGADSITPTQAPPVSAPTTQPITSLPITKPQQMGQYQFNSTDSGTEPPTSPSIRKMAHLFGLDLRRVHGSGNGGRITYDDIKAHMSHLQAVAFQEKPQADVAPVAKPLAALPDFSKFGPIDTQAVSSLRKKIGQKMSFKF